ncbi:MAG TPA: MarR family winged helix-turn-helix transcriptional regulator, partial [Pseudolabrys sp.]
MTTANPQRIAAVRRFNRFYTRQIGVLRKGYLDSPFSLGEGRVLYEIAHGNGPTASDIARVLDLDAGYLSRMLRHFEKRGLLTRKTSATDARQSHLALTARGAKTFAPLERRSQQQAGAMLGQLKPASQARLVAAMGEIETLLDNAAAAAREEKPQIILRSPRPGDFGWIVARNAELYAQEYGWSQPFEGLCAQIVADFANKNDPECERCWIAELNGDNVGTV